MSGKVHVPQHLTVLIARLQEPKFTVPVLLYCRVHYRDEQTVGPAARTRKD